MPHKKDYTEQAPVRVGQVKALITLVVLWAVGFGSQAALEPATPEVTKTCKAVIKIDGTSKSNTGVPNAASASREAVKMAEAMGATHISCVADKANVNVECQAYKC